jgi:hypothetical protein
MEDAATEVADVEALAKLVVDDDACGGMAKSFQQASAQLLVVPSSWLFVE